MVLCRSWVFQRRVIKTLRAAAYITIICLTSDLESSAELWWSARCESFSTSSSLYVRAVWSPWDFSDLIIQYLYTVVKTCILTEEMMNCRMKILHFESLIWIVFSGAVYIVSCKCFCCSGSVFLKFGAVSPEGLLVYWYMTGSAGRSGPDVTWCHMMSQVNASYSSALDDDDDDKYHLSHSVFPGQPKSTVCCV